MKYLVLSHLGSYWSDYYSQKLLSKLDHLMTCCYSQCRNTCKEESEQQLFLEQKYFCVFLGFLPCGLGFCSKLIARCNSVLKKKKCYNSVYRTMVECDKWQTVRYGFLSHEAKPSVIRAHEHCLSLITRDHVRYTFYTTRTVQCNLWNVNFLQLFLKKFNEIFLQCDKYFWQNLSHSAQCDLDS